MGLIQSAACDCHPLPPGHCHCAGIAISIINHATTTETTDKQRATNKTCLLCGGQVVQVQGSCFCHWVYVFVYV